MHLIIRLVGVLSLSVFYGCSGITVNSDYDVSTDFSELKTWSWKQNPPEENFDREDDNSLVRRRIQGAIASELAEKGFLEIISGTSDFYVTYHVRTQEKTQIQPMPGPFIRPGWGMGYYSEVYQYEEGTLIIDFIDAKTQYLIWRGIAKEVVDWQQSPEQKTKLIDEAVKEVLAQFPPKRS